MTQLLRSTFFHRFLGGFALGAATVVLLNPTTAQATALLIV